MSSAATARFSRRSRTMVTAIAVSALGASILAAPAVAQQDPATNATVREYSDGAVVTVPTEWEVGEPLTLTGEDFLNSAGDAGSVIAVRIDGDDGPAPNTPADHPDAEALGLWDVVYADDDGSFTQDIEFPSVDNSDLTEELEVGGEHDIILLTGSLGPNDRSRGGVAGTVTIVDELSDPQDPQDPDDPQDPEDPQEPGELEYEHRSYETGVNTGYQIGLDPLTRQVYLSDANWRQETWDPATGEVDVTREPTGKLSVFDIETRERLDDHSFLSVTRNDGTGAEGDPYPWGEIEPESYSSMRSTFSPYGVAVDPTNAAGEADATIITTTARQQSQSDEFGYGGGLVLYSASQGAPTDDDRIWEYEEDGEPVLDGPRRIDVNTQTNRAYVTNFASGRSADNDGTRPGYITVLDTTERGLDAVLAQIPLPVADNGSIGAIDVTVDEDNGLVYVGTIGGGDGNLWVFAEDDIEESDPTETSKAESQEANENVAQELDAQVGLNARPTYIPELQRVYVSSFEEQTVTVVEADPASDDYGTAIEVIETGATNSVTADAELGLVYSANLGDQEVAVFDAETHEELDFDLSTAGNAVNIGIDPDTRDLWVSNFDDAGAIDVFSPQVDDGTVTGFDHEVLDTEVVTGYQLALDPVNGTVYNSDANWRQETWDPATGEVDVTREPTGKLSVFDIETRERLDDHSFLSVTRNDGTGAEGDPYPWGEIEPESYSSMRSTFSPYGVAVDPTNAAGEADATIITTTARQQSQSDEFGYGGGLVLYSASQGAPTDDDRIWEYEEDGEPVLDGPRRIDVNTQTNRAYVTNFASGRSADNDGTRPGYITVLDTTERGLDAVLAQIPLPVADNGSIGAIDVTVDEDNGLVYVGTIGGGDGNLWVFAEDDIEESDPTETSKAESQEANENVAQELDAQVGLNARPTYIPELQRVYVSSFDEETITVVDADLNSDTYGTALEVIETGPTNSVTADPELGLIYSANLGDQEVAVFATQTHEQVGALPTSGNAVNIAIDPETRDLWVSNFDDAGIVDVFTITTDGEPGDPDDLDRVTCPENPPSFTDVSENSTHGRAIGCLAGLDIVRGLGDDTFDQWSDVSREQAASMIARWLSAYGVDLPNGPMFPDVTEGGTHAANISALAELGVVEGTRDGNFAPFESLSRAQMASILSRALDVLGQQLPGGAGRFSDVTAGMTHGEEINAGAEAGLIVGYEDGSFGPADDVLRSQLASLLARAIDHIEKG